MSIFVNQGVKDGLETLNLKQQRTTKVSIPATDHEGVDTESRTCLPYCVPPTIRKVAQIAHTDSHAADTPAPTDIAQELTDNVEIIIAATTCWQMRAWPKQTLGQTRLPLRR